MAEAGALTTAAEFSIIALVDGDPDLGLGRWMTAEVGLRLLGKLRRPHGRRLFRPNRFDRAARVPPASPPSRAYGSAGRHPRVSRQSQERVPLVSGRTWRPSTQRGVMAHDVRGHRDAEDGKFAHQPLGKWACFEPNPFDGPRMKRNRKRGEAISGGHS
jgi:hypothetical protein